MIFANDLQSRFGYVKGIKEVPLIIMNKAFPNDFIVFGEKDLIRNEMRRLAIKEFSLDALKEGLFLIHADTHGHMVLKDLEENLRSVKLSDTIMLGPDKNALSDFYLKYVTEDSKNHIGRAFFIISDDKCLSALIDSSDKKYLEFQNCTSEDNQIFSAIPIDIVRKIVEKQGPLPEESYQIESLKDVLDQLNKTTNLATSSID